MRKVIFLLSAVKVVVIATAIAAVATLCTPGQKADYRPVAAHQTIELTQVTQPNDNLTYTRAVGAQDWRLDKAKSFEIYFLAFALPSLYLSLLFAARRIEDI